MSARLLALAALTLGGMATSPAQAATKPAPCNRACLQGTLDRYVNALTRHDARGLPIASTVENRENMQRLAPGTGASWHDIARIRARQDFIDPQTGNAVARMAVDTVQGKLASFSVRIKRAGGHLVEIDTQFNRGTGPFEPENLLEPDVLWTAVVPSARRVPRERLIAITDAYLEAISRHDGTKVPFGMRCDRFESGKKMSNNAANLSNESGQVTCADSLNNLKGQEVEQRRFPLVDEERGVVLAYGFLQHKERTPPQALALSEMFKIVDGKIRLIEDIETMVPYPADGGFGASLRPDR